MAHMALPILLLVLIADCAIEMGFIVETVSFLHRRAGNSFQLTTTNPEFLFGKPAGLEVNQGHTSNGAAGTALILVGILGFLVMWYDRFMARKHNSTGKHSAIYVFWVVLTVLSFLLTLSALAYTFAVTNQTSGQTIDLSQVVDNKPYLPDKWTPETWFEAVLQTPLASRSDIDIINSHLKLMKGWKYNLIPMFLLGLAIACLAVHELITSRKLNNSRIKSRI